MKYINLLSNLYELTCLFPTAKLKFYTTLKEFSISKIKLEMNDEIFEVTHHTENLYNKLKKLENIFDIDSLYINPIEDLTIVCDRKLWTELYFPLMRYHKDIFEKLEKIYVEKNVTVFFNFAFLEAVDYEDYEEYFLYDFKFNHIKISDYELFKGKKNFYYDSFYCLYHLFAEPQMMDILYPNSKYSQMNYHLHFNKIFENLNINPLIDRSKLYSHLALKPRYHRAKFLLEASNNNILRFGVNNINEQFLEEYSEFTNANMIHTDNTKKHSKNHLKYFNKEIFDKLLKIKNEINITPNEPDFLYNHLKNYFLNKEYNESYIEVTGETHCIFDLKYGFFTEKSIKPILAEKFAMIYGSKKVYTEYKKLGIDLFLNEFGLNGIEDKDELQQIDMIINFLKNTNKPFLRNLYIEKYEIIKSNKEKLINHFCKIMNDVNFLLLKQAKNKLI
jgi:hypothetical protein